MSVDHELIQTRCAEIVESINRLEKIAALSKGIFLQDQDVKDIASYRLLIAIEACLNICYHFCSKQLKKIPDNYANCFEILGEEGIIGKDLSERLQNMARFRNLLVHVYYHVDDEQLYEVVSYHLDDLREFCEAIVSRV